MNAIGQRGCVSAGAAATKLALRIDDVGASSKRYEVYSNHRVGNWLFLKYFPPFRAWGPYRELNCDDWCAVFKLLDDHRARLTVAITAAWVGRRGMLTPFPERFPREADALKEGRNAGLIEVANHGLTHCVISRGAFKPRWFSSNRLSHREFWAWVPTSVQENHLGRAQQILESHFETQVVTFVPPGYVFTAETLKMARHHGLRYVCSRTELDQSAGMIVVPDNRGVAFHDRDIVLHGVEWLERVLAGHEPGTFCSVHEIAEQLDTARSWHPTEDRQSP